MVRYIKISSSLRVIFTCHVHSNIISAVPVEKQPKKKKKNSINEVQTIFIHKNQTNAT